MPLTQHADCRAGIGVPDLSPEIVVRGDIHPLVDHDRSEAPGIQDIIFIHEALCFLNRTELPPVGEEHVSLRVDVAGIAGGWVKAVNLPVIDDDSAVSPVMIQVSSDSQNGVCLLGHTGRHIKVS